MHFSSHRTVARRQRTCLRLHVWAVASLALLLLLPLASCALPGMQPSASNGTAAQGAVATASTAPAFPSPSATPNPPGIPPEGILSPAVHETVEWYLSRMTLDEKLGQLFVVEIPGTSDNADADAMVRQLHAGGVLIFGANMASPDQLRQYMADLQAKATLPLFTSIDEEGGEVDRMATAGFDAPLPSAQALGATGDPQQAYAAGLRAAQELQAAGLNTDFAPVADVHGNPDAFEGSRLFGDTPTQVSQYAGAFLLGLQAQNVVGSLKHWPGLGSVAGDPHQELPTNPRSRAELQQTEFAAFAQLLPLQPGMVMVTDLLVPAYDATRPANLSPALVQGVLRDQLGYSGVVITDDLNMRGITDTYSLPEAGVMALAAGDDLLLGASSPDVMSQMIAAIKAAIASGRLSQERIDTSLRRILALKVRFGLLPLHVTPPNNVHLSGA